MKANVGMQHPVMALVDTYTPGSSISYKDGMVVAEALGSNVSWNRASDTFRGDDVELDSDNGVQGYTIEFEPSGLKDNVRAKMMGETMVNTEYEVNSTTPPDLGFGYMRVMRETNGNGVVETTYEGWWFRKLKFGITTEETRTKGESLEWRTPTLTGIGAGVNLDNSGVLKFAIHRTFASGSDCIAWLDNKAGIQATTT